MVADSTHQIEFVSGARGPGTLWRGASLFLILPLSESSVTSDFVNTDSEVLRDVKSPASTIPVL
jgi:hypothetical protein